MNDPFNTGLPDERWMTAFAVFFAFSFCWAFWREIKTLLRGQLPTVRELRQRLGLRLAIVFALAVVCMSGGTKGPGGYASNRIAQYITALRSGLVVDDSGVVARFTESEAIRYFNDENGAIVAAARDSVSNSVATITAFGVALTSAPYTVAYVSADLSRASPGVLTNHNVAATIERVDMTGGVLRVWVWYSETPFEPPNISFDASVADGTWVTLVAVTNSWPTTTSINGADCVRYDFSVPAGMVGVPLRPNYELAWGGYGTNDYLIVPIGGLLVSTNGVECAPYTGWDRSWPEPWGTNLAVRYVGGVAVQATYNGSNYVGRVL
ncbi:MAG: hypothetical protein WCR06_04830 [bacterium]